MSDGAPQTTCQDKETAEANGENAIPRTNRQGVIGFVLVLVAIGVLFSAMIIAATLYSTERDAISRGTDTLDAVIRRSEENPDTLGHRTLIGALMLAGSILLAAGTGCGFWGLRTGARRKTAAVGAVILGCACLLCLLASFIIVWFNR